jgi:hypothetical protein
VRPIVLTRPLGRVGRAARAHRAGLSRGG